MYWSLRLPVKCRLRRGGLGAHPPSPIFLSPRKVTDLLDIRKSMWYSKGGTVYANQHDILNFAPSSTVKVERVAGRPALTIDGLQVLAENTEMRLDAIAAVLTKWAEQNREVPCR